MISSHVDSPVGMRWTGHPLIDIGVATLTAFSERSEPASVTVIDLRAFADYALDAMFTPHVQSYCSVLFTMASALTNPAMKLPARREATRELLTAWLDQEEVRLGSCTFCHRNAVRRVHRDLLPMLSGRTVTNFYPSGSSGLPICGLCLLAVLALTVGAPMCSGRALIIEAEDKRLLLRLTADWLPKARERIDLSRQTGVKPPSISHPLTRAVEALVHLAESADEETTEGGGAITVYHLSNSGQGPTIDIHRLPSHVVRFVWRAQQQRYRDAWQALVRRGWSEAAPRRKTRSTSASEDAASDRTVLRNAMYDRLFSLPAEAGPFIRRYFRQDRHPAAGPSPTEGPGVARASAHWALVDLFLKEVMGMHKTRIEAIVGLADTLGEEIVSQSDKKLFRSVVQVGSYHQMRNILIKLSTRRLRKGQAPVLTLDRYLTVFEEAEEAPRHDWRLAWDLTVIRVLEKLYEARWFEGNSDALAEVDSEIMGEERE